MAMKRNTNRVRPGEKPLAEGSRDRRPSPQHTKIAVSFEYDIVAECSVFALAKLSTCSGSPKTIPLCQDK
jgi:hypothetical protein